MKQAVTSKVETSAINNKEGEKKITNLTYRKGVNVYYTLFSFI